MGVLDMFIKPEETQKTPVGQTSVPAGVPQEVVVPVQTNNVMPQVTVAATATIDADTQKKIWDTIVAKNLPGPDYLEFKNTVAGLIGIVDVEEKQFLGAYNVLKRSYPNFSKEIIMQSIDTYINIVKEEKETGLKELEGVRKENIGDRLERIESIKASDAEVMKQIEELNKLHSENLRQITTLEGEVSTATGEIKIKEETFINSVNGVIETLNLDKTKVSNMNV